MKRIVKKTTYKILDADGNTLEKGFQRYVCAQTRAPKLKLSKYEKLRIEKE